VKILDYAKTKQIAGAGTLKFEKPVTLLLLAVAFGVFLTQWAAYAFVVEGLGGTGFINLVLSTGIALLVTYKLFPFLKLAKSAESAESE